MSRLSVLLAVTCLACNGGGSKPGGSSGTSTETKPTTETPASTSESTSVGTSTTSDTDTDTDTGPGTVTEDTGTGTVTGTTDTTPGTTTDTGTAPELPPTGPGCAGALYTLLQDAIDAAAPGDVIEVCAGTFAENLTITGKALTLRAVDGPAVTIIDATGGGRALIVSAGADVVLEGFTVRNGVTGARGGNLECNASNLVIRDNVFLGGEADRGGGVSYTACTGLIEDNTFRDNHAISLGGGLYLDGTVDLLRNVFEANATDKNGGAAYVDEGFGDIQGNVVRLNTGVDDGAGIYVSGGAPAVDGNTFEDNDCDGEGGGLRVKLSSASITNNTFTRNHADWRGGGARVSHDESVITGNTWVENTTWGMGGALFLFESASTVSFEVFERNEAEEGGAIAVLEGWAGPVIEDSVFDGNEADLGAHLYVELLIYTTRLRRVDLLNGEADVSGGAVYATPGSDLDLGNVIFASNTAAVSGGAVAVDGATGRIHNAVAIWNEAPDGSVLAVTNGAAFDVANTVFRVNTGGAAISTGAGAPPTLRYDDFSGNTANASGMADPVGQNGNVADTPDFVDAAGGDYTLDANSALVDQGDPAISDPDGTRSDIGRFGGPDL